MISKLNPKVSSFKCTNFYYSSVATLIYYTTVTSSMSDYEAGTFRCMVCAKEFLTKGEADEHYDQVHSDETVLGE